MDKKAPALKRLIDARLRLLAERPFWGILAFSLFEFNFVEDQTTETVRTDGRTVHYNPNYINNLPPAVVETLLAHLSGHVVLEHFERRRKRDVDRWDEALDHTINNLLKEEGFEIPPNSFCDEKYKGLSAEDVYKQISKREAPPSEKLMDDHRPPEKEEEGDLPSGGKKPAKLSPQNARDKLMEAAMLASKMGKLPGVVRKWINGLSEPKLNWRELLRQFLVTTSREEYRLIPPQKKHVWRGIYLPSLRGETFEIAVVLDTSGSITQAQFQDFISEVRGITEQFPDYRVHLLFCDMSIHDYILLTPGEDWPEKMPKKDGGTSFIEPFRWVENENVPISALVYFTDADGTFPPEEPTFPTLWIVAKPSPQSLGGKPPWGMVTYYEPNDDGEGHD